MPVLGLAGFASVNDLDCASDAWRCTKTVRAVYRANSWHNANTDNFNWNQGIPGAGDQRSAFSMCAEISASDVRGVLRIQIGIFQ